MPDIVKTEGIVLKRLDHGDSSRIITVYTKEFGKFSGMVKGAKSAKSKIGMVLDVLNLADLVFYNKENRDLQLITQAELLDHFSHLKSNFDLLTYASAVVELIEKLVLDHELNERLYRGTIRILELLDQNPQDYEFRFAKYLLFFIEELGYQLPLSQCIDCRNDLVNNRFVYLNYNTGFYCGECGKNHSYFEKIDEELFNLILCLNIKNCDSNKFGQNLIKKSIKLFERYLMFHNPDFKGLKTLSLF